MATLRVMTFNSAGALGTEGAGVNAWAHRAALNVRTILRHAPDLIGFQELDQGNLATYREQLPGYAHLLGPHAENQEPYGYNAIFWDPSRLERLDDGGFWLSRTPDRWSVDWGTACVRVATWARFRVLESGAGVPHLNTHLDHISESARVEGSGLILRRLDELGAGTVPVILTGDFNCNPWSPGYRLAVETTFTDQCYHRFRARGFADTFLTAGNEDSLAAYTHHGFLGERYTWAHFHLAGRIDWILTLDGTQHIRTKACLIARDQAHPRYPSDHYPVVAEVLLG